MTDARKTEVHRLVQAFRQRVSSASNQRESLFAGFWQRFLQLAPTSFGERHYYRWAKGQRCPQEIEYIDQIGRSWRCKEHIMRDLDRLNHQLGIYWGNAHILLPMMERVYRQEKRPVRVLDVGSGHGGMLLYLAKILQRQTIPVELAGVDLNPFYVQMAQQRALEERQSQIHFFQGDATALPLADGAYDILFTMETLHHLSPVKLYLLLEEMKRLASWGLFLWDIKRTILSVFLADAFLSLRSGACSHDGQLSYRYAYSPLEIRFLLDCAGLEAVKIYPWPSFLPCYWLRG